MSLTLEKAFISDRASLSIAEFLADETSLSKAKIKDCMAKGGVWLKRDDQEPLRIKKHKAEIKLDDEVHIYYDELLLKQQAPLLKLLDDQQQYSIWLQPEGLMRQVSLYSDHLMLETVLEKSLPAALDCHLLLPSLLLDSGLLLLVHTRNAAVKFQQMEEEEQIQRTLRLEFYGEMRAIKPLLEDTLAGDIQVTDASAVIIQAQCYELDIDAAIDEQLQMLSSDDADDFSNRVEINCSQLHFTCPISKEARHYKSEFK